MVNRCSIVTSRTRCIVQIRTNRCFAGQICHDAPTRGWLTVGLDCIWVSDRNNELAFAKCSCVSETQRGEAAVGGAFCSLSFLILVNGENSQAAARIGSADSRRIRASVD